MPDSPLAIMAGIQQKIALLTQQRDNVSAKCKSLADRIEALESALKERDRRLQQANLEIEFLTLSHRLAETPQALADARKEISRLIRKVDAAIALIKTDPADL